VVILIGALASTLGAATFALATNRDLVLREDRLAKEERARKNVTAGELLPKTPSSVLVLAPGKAVDRDGLQKLLGSECELAGVKAILLNVAIAPATAIAFGEKPRVFQVVTERTPKCAVANFWLPASWVVPRPVEATPPTANQTPAAATSGAGTETTAPPTPSP
jgi:hypothetical protein